MKNYLQLTVFLTVFLTIWGFNLVAPQAELIEPSRSLKSPSDTPGQMTVFSEPPGLDVKLDGAAVGTAPVRIKSLEPGRHRLQVGKSVTEIFIEPGQTFHISLFRNRFIQFQVAPKEPAAPSDTDASSAMDRRAAKAPPQQFSTKAENREAWQRWMQFVNGTSTHF